MDSILTAMVNALMAAGLHVLQPNGTATLPRLEWPMVALRTYRHQRRDIAQNGLLGYHYSSGRTTGREVEVQAELTIYSPYRGGPQLCEDALDQVLRTLDAGLSMANLTLLDCGPVEYDPDADCYCCRILATLTAWDVTFLAND